MQRSCQLPIALAMVLACGTAVTLPVRAHAQDRKEPQEQQEQQERKPGPADLSEAIKIAEKYTGGTAAGAETVVRDGREVHEVRVLIDEERVRTVRVDPKTGAIIVPRERAQR